MMCKYVTGSNCAGIPDRLAAGALQVLEKATPGGLALPGDASRLEAASLFLQGAAALKVSGLDVHQVRPRDCTASRWHCRCP